MLILASDHWRKINGINFSQYKTFTNILNIWVWTSSNKFWSMVNTIIELHSISLITVTDYLSSEKRIAIHTVIVKQVLRYVSNREVSVSLQPYRLALIFLSLVPCVMVKKCGIKFIKIWQRYWSYNAQPCLLMEWRNYEISDMLKTVYPLKTTFCRGIKISLIKSESLGCKQFTGNKSRRQKLGWISYLEEWWFKQLPLLY